MKWKNIGKDTNTYFITGTIAAWQPLFGCAPARDILLQDLDFYRGKYGCRILAYVIMPEHYHLVVQLARPEDLHGWLRDVQGDVGSELSKWLRATRRLEELSVYAQHASGRSRLAVWKEQARAVPITRPGVLRVKIDYVHANPVRRKLVEHPEDWAWSSWRGLLRR